MCSQLGCILARCSFLIAANKDRLQRSVTSISFCILKTKLQPFRKKLFKTDLLNDDRWAKLENDTYDSDVIEVENPYSTLSKY